MSRPLPPQLSGGWYELRPAAERAAALVKYGPSGMPVRHKRMRKAVPAVYLALVVCAVVGAAGVVPLCGAALVVHFVTGLENLWCVGRGCEDVTFVGGGVERRSQRGRSYKRMAVFIGDSLTTGSVGDDWLARVEARFPDTLCVRECRNGDMAHNALERCTRIASLLRSARDAGVRADVCICIGTNDLLAASHPKLLRGYVVGKGWDATTPGGKPTLQTLEQSLRKILHALTPVASSTLLLVPPGLGEQRPPSGEGIPSYARSYHAAAKTAANTVVVDLGPRVTGVAETVAKSPLVPFHPAAFARMTSNSVVLWWFFGLGWAKIADMRNLTWSHDGVHLTPLGGEVVASAISHFLA